MATVGSTGVITGKSAGTATLTCKAKDGSGKVTAKTAGTSRKQVMKQFAGCPEFRKIMKQFGL